MALAGTGLSFLQGRCPGLKTTYLQLVPSRQQVLQMERGRWGAMQHMPTFA